ncbi:MAG: methylase [Ruminococcus flavefaciens]|nr:methylase [Ruminococcus flavefaciens]
MNDKQKIKSAKKFVQRWQGRGYEKGESQQFWLDLLVNVYEVPNITGFITFEEQVKLDHTSFIDGYIETTHVMIEQKSIGKDLRKGIPQSDGISLTPFQQAKRYASELPYSKRPRWIVTCNFAEFLVYDMEKPNCEPEQIFLKDLSKEYYRLQFLVDTGNDSIKKEMDISLKAGELVGKLYDLILKQYKNPDSPETLKSLNMLCVRLVFCLYAEDSGIFGKRKMFGNYLKQFSAKDVRKALIELFQVLDTKPECRDPYLDDDLTAFPYVNGELFADENIEIPRFTDEIVELLVNGASKAFNWAEISPTIFGAVFESTLNPDTRRSGGMHYTSIENIHKVIDPLFLDDLRAELATILEIKVNKTRLARLDDFRNRLAALTFLDPACGSGNFLTETYISLRRLENEALRAIYDGQKMFNLDGLIKVGIHQFYGIEINDFAVTVAKTALWIAESQMMRETEEIVEHDLNFLPLKSYANITEANALRIDWADVVPKDKLSYIMGNPPFVGKKEQTKEQKQDVVDVFGKKVKGVGNLDYVSCWYKKAFDLMNGTTIRTALVSTNSITQGEQVPILWQELISLGICIDFAYRTFQWDSEATLKAHVHCVIIGFSTMHNNNKKKLYNAEKFQLVDNINPYLINAPTVIINTRSKSISANAPQIYYGSMPIDDGHLILNADDVKSLLQENKDNAKYIRKYVGGAELIKGKERWCLWLVGASPKDLQKSSIIKERIRKTADFRKSSNRPQTLALADTPSLFGEIRQPETDMIAIPKVSSENRRYIPISYVSSDIIVNGSALIVPNASLFHFGVLISNVHMAFMRTVCGRMKSDYQYSGNVVYNNFPWCNPTPEQREHIEHTAQAILNARALYSDCTLADLYDELTMPPELRKAHQANDFAVMNAYGFDKKITESECVAKLMKMYQKLTK